MRKLIVCAVLIAGMAGLSAVTDSAAFAQKKDKTAKPDAGAKAGLVEVNEGKDGKWRFNVRNSEGKYLAGSAAFATEKDALKGVEDLKEALKGAKVTVGKGKGKDKAKEK